MNLRIMRHVPVSYTHLDVYKRQIDDHRYTTTTGEAPRSFGCPRRAPQDDNSRGLLMTTGAAENTAGRAGDKEKVEKRRALGRGLESLLPGPRAVIGTARPAGAPTSTRGDATAAAGELRSAGRPGAAAPTEVPNFVRSDKGHLDDKSISQDGGGPRGEAVAGVIRAVADEGWDARASRLSPLEPASHEFAATGGTAERSAGQPGAAGPTFSRPDSSPVAAADDTITIYAQAESQAPANLVVNLAIADIDKNPFQTRSVGDDDKLEELSDSIKANGVVQPIMVRCLLYTSGIEIGQAPPQHLSRGIDLPPLPLFDHQAKHLPHVFHRFIVFPPCLLYTSRCV